MIIAQLFWEPVVSTVERPPAGQQAFGGITEDPGTLVVEVEVDPALSSKHSVLTLRIKQGPYNIEVNQDFKLDLPQPVKETGQQINP